MTVLDVIIPVHNERHSLEPLIAEWHASLSGLGIRYRFIIVEDGSTDDSDRMLRELRARYPIIHVHSGKRRGYQTAITEGMKHIRSRYVLHVDADRQYDPDIINAFWQERDTVDVLKGYRIRRKDPLIRNICSSLFKIAFLALFPGANPDPSCPVVFYRYARIRRYRADLAMLQEGFWWGFSAMCRKRKLTVSYIPIRHMPRRSDTTKIYHLRKFPGIAVRNMAGLVRLRRAA